MGELNGDDLKVIDQKFMHVVQASAMAELMRVRNMEREVRCPALRRVKKDT